MRCPLETLGRGCYTMPFRQRGLGVFVAVSSRGERVREIVAPDTPESWRAVAAKLARALDEADPVAALV